MSSHLRDTTLTSTTRNLTEATNARTAQTNLVRSGSAPNFLWTLTDWHTVGDPVQAVATRQSGGTTQNRTETVVLKGPGESTANWAKKTFAVKNWGEVLVSEEMGSSSAVTRTYDYYESPSAFGSYTFLKSVSVTGGGWEAYEYYPGSTHLAGTMKYEFRPFLDSPASPSFNPSLGEVTYFEYSADPYGKPTRPALIQTTVNSSSVITAKATITYSEQSVTFNTYSFYLVQATRRDYSDASNYLETVTKYYRENTGNEFYRNLVHSVRHPNGVRQSFAYQRGTWSGGAFTKSGNNGFDNASANRMIVISGADGTSYTTHDGYDIEDLALVDGKSTMEVLIRDERAKIVRTEKHIWDGSWSLLSYVTYTYDAAGLQTGRTESYGVSSVVEASATYVGAQKSADVDIDGTSVSYTYDPAGRVKTITKPSGPVTTFNYDAAGRTIGTNLAGGEISLTTTHEFDDAGRLKKVTASGGQVTNYTYSAQNNRVTVVTEGAGDRVTESFPDERLKSVTGDGVVAEFYTYGVDGSGNHTSEGRRASASSPNVTTVTRDWLGREKSITRLAWSGGTVTQTLTYNANGQLSKISQPGLADKLFLYDSLGTLYREGLDVGATSGVLDLASTDRITDYEWTYFASGGNWWRRETAKIYATASSGVATQVSKIETQLNGFSAAGSGYTRLSHGKHTDAFGNVTTAYVEIDPSIKTLIATTIVPDSTTAAVQTVVNGMLTSAKDTSGLTTTLFYDDVERRVKVTDSRGNSQTTEYYENTNRIYRVKDAAEIAQATYTYDAVGRISTVTDAFSKVSRYEYTARNEIEREWGDKTYPISYTYNTYGQQVTMSTYRGGTGWSGSSWPTVTGDADTTTWAYQESTGLLASKTDAASNAVTYTYKPAGQIETRKWARKIVIGGTEVPVTTTYDYSTVTGELMSTTYNDGTPTTSYTYNRLGQSNTVSDATGTRTFGYNLAATLELEYEDLPTGFYGDRRITRDYDTATGKVGRYNRFFVGPAAGGTEYDQSYGYDSLGRLNKAENFDYAYLTNSNLIQSVDQTSWNYSDIRTYATTHDWVASRTMVKGSTTKATFVYERDTMGRINNIAKTGEVFSRYGNGTEGLKTSYDYDDRSQLKSEVTKVGATTTTLTGRDDSFTFDNIGNRVTATHNGNTATYSSDNKLNQYTERTVPGTFDVAGAAASGATVTVNSSNTDVVRHGEYFFKGHPLTNTSSAVYTSLSISDGTTTTPLLAFLPKTPEPFVYDADGNLTSDGRWDYTYDAENRLVSMQTRSALLPGIIPNPDARRLEFKYDYLGRRVSKTVRAGYNGTVYTTIVTDLLNVYDGWNLILELDATTSRTKVRAHMWGIDLSGSLQDAGGVGGLLYTYDYATFASYLPAYDAIGNIHAMVNAATGTLGAAFEYDAFGNTLRESGPMAAAMNFRFSTKYTDLETGLVYYGLRYYSPSLGRFINRDPIGEQGGINLYAFVSNSGVNGWDYLGLEGEDDAKAREKLKQDEAKNKEAAKEPKATGIYLGDGLWIFVTVGKHGNEVTTTVSVERDPAYNKAVPSIVSWTSTLDALNRHAETNSGKESDGGGPNSAGRNGQQNGLSVEFELVIRKPHPEAGVKASAIVVVDPATGKVLRQESNVGTTSVLGANIKGGGNTELMAVFDKDSGLWNIGFRGSVYSKPLVFADGFVKGIGGGGNVTLVIDFALQVKVDPATGRGIYGAAHDAYPSYNIKINGSTIYDFQQHSIPVLKLDPPLDVFEKGKF